MKLTEREVETIVMAEAQCLGAATIGHISDSRKLIDHGMVRVVRTSAGAWYEITDYGRQVLRLNKTFDDAHYEQMVARFKRMEAFQREWFSEHMKGPPRSKAELARAVGLDEKTLNFGLTDSEASVILDDPWHPKDPS